MRWFFLAIVPWLLGSCSTSPDFVDLRDGDEIPEPPGLPVDYGKADQEGVGSVHKPLPDGASLDGDFRVFYGPNEPLMAVELALLNQVVEARRADSRTFAPGENPYRIRYAVYNLRARDVVNALVEAKKADVFVQVLVDARQMGPDYPWNTAYKYLKRQGFTVYDSQKGLSETQRREANVIGVEITGYMHLKTRLFEHPGEVVLLTGSANPGDNVAYSDDSLHLVRESQVVQAFSQCYDAILFEDQVVNEWREGAPVNVLFSGNASGLTAGAQILEWIAEEQEQILIKVFSLRDFSAKGLDDSLVDLLGKKVAQGVPVYVITDRKQSDGVNENMVLVNRDDPTDDRLRQVGVRVYETLNTASPYTAMHHKSAVLGRTGIRVISGSANWSFSGLGSSRDPARNLESVLFLDTDALDWGLSGRRYLANWFRILYTYADQSVTIDDELPFDEVFGEFVRSPFWPEESLSFLVQGGEIEQDALFVGGDLPGLGAWGSLHQGLPLLTDEVRYPTWWSYDPLSLPLGQPFQWRLWAGFFNGNPGSWEPGSARQALAGPGPFDEPDSEVLLKADWQ